MPERIESVNLSEPHVQLSGTPEALFVARVIDEGRRFVKGDRWATSARSLGEVGTPVLRVSASNCETGLFEYEGVLVHVALVGGHAYASVAGDAEQSEAALRRLRELLPAPDPTARHEVNVEFWTYGQHGPEPLSRSIAVPGWDEISDNYGARTRERLEPLMREFEPAHGGQLILWHGQAGTGKTFGLRALAWEWREWCEIHYIVDPDAFFGQHADYLMSVLLHPEYDDDEDFGYPGISPFFALHAPAGTQEKPKPWRLLLLEDTGELLAADAKAVIGQGLSRFLNVVDGLIGQGLRVLVLVTTNEPIRRLHPAVARPGRCAANVEFVPLARDEAQAWLDRHDVDAQVDEAATLASLYAMVEGLEVVEAQQAAGFSGAS